MKVVQILIIFLLILSSCVDESEIYKKNARKRKAKNNISEKVIKKKELYVVPEKYTIDVIPKIINSSKIEYKIITNIPTPVLVSVSIDLLNQNPKETYIGYSERRKLNSKESTFIMDISKAELPKADYSFNVTFYHKWGAKKGNPNAKNVKETIKGKKIISLKGSGVSLKRKKELDKLQLWVMENVYVGTKWNKQKFIKKLGKYKELKVTKRNPRIIKAYYFKKADMTIIVNVLKKEVSTWFDGKFAY